MADKKKHINLDEFLSKTEIPYSKSKEDVWEVISKKIDTDAHRTIQTRSKKRNIFLYSAAAGLTLFLGLTAFFKLYTIELTAPPGQHVSAELPDGSKVHLNAATTLTYHPYWWRINREVKLEGESFFKVVKGKMFSVSSEFGKTEVLGTSFNIFARKNKYSVHCFSGKVKVSSTDGASELILENQSVIIEGNKLKKNEHDPMIKDALAWKENRFVFTSVPVSEVFEELERQFDIQIELNVPVSDLYTGKFKRGSSAEEILKIICKPLGLDYQKTHINTYKISKE